MTEDQPGTAHWKPRLPHMSPLRAFLTVCMGVFLFIFLASALVTFMLPETYSATARVHAPQAAEVRMLQSPELLRQVAHQLDLPRTLAVRYGETKPLDEPRVEDLLRRSLAVRRVPGTDLVEIRAYSQSPSEAAEWANAIAEAGAKRDSQGSASLRLIDLAVPPKTPVRPNKPLNLAMGAIVGLLLGVMAGGLGAKLAVGFDSPPSTSV